MNRILVIDNYDSFTYNLVQYVSELEGTEVTVYTNDDERINNALEFNALIISPGPGLPEEAGSMIKIFEIENLPPTLGVCLGHQAIAEAFGGKLYQLSDVYHGVATSISIVSKEEKLFDGIETGFKAGRYHSWVVDPGSLEECPLKITCVDENNTIMGIRHESKNIMGLQFHPESVLTPEGRKMIGNFIRHYVSA